MATEARQTASNTTPPNSRWGAIDRWFEITQRGSTFGREIRGGLVTFFAMAYIVALNPLIIGTAPDGAGNLLGGLPYQDAAGQVIGANVSHAITLVAGATALIAGLATIAMGVIGRYPLGIATGLGLNALLAFTIAPQMTWPQAMGLVVIEGLVIALLVLTGFRTAVFRAVPPSMRAAISVGLGLFIAFAGLVDSGVIRKPEGSVPVQLGIDGSLTGWPMLVFAIGLFVVAILHVRKVKGALLLSIVIATVIAVIIQAAAHLPAQSDQHPTGWALNVPTIGHLVSVPDLSLIGQVSVFGAFGEGIHRFLPLVMLIFALILSDFFDTMGTVVGVGAEGNLLDDNGNPPHLGPVLMVDALSATAGGIGSVSSNTAYIESAAGVGEGARTGLASVVTGLGFLLAMFFAPLATIVPSEAAAPVLVFVGFLMMSQVTKINWADVEIGLPAFLTIILMPFTYSITTGIGAGFLMMVILKLVRGKAREIHPLLYGIAVAFLIYFLQGLIMKLVS
ncbi:NCS2 family permease [Microlunatus elymi]|uniref:NCS2 family permease n=1 Tax=Microlunatus elymi TaxID=2596828 RepID=A0A516Q3T8_9ACTN|nr:NCS2 family permease [Microlunatus elymi]QDP98098.1 NCS2 family permease [Microlunatus elymi]